VLEARKEEKQQVVVQAVKHFLRYVKCHDGEIALSYLPVIFQDFSLKLGNHDKQQEFLDLLKDWRWIYVRADYYHPDRHGGKAVRGRARAYGIGPAMSGKFRNPSSSTTQGRNRPILLSPIFSEVAFGEVDVLCIEDYLDSLNSPADCDFAVENCEVVQDLG